MEKYLGYEKPSFHPETIASKACSSYLPLGIPLGHLHPPLAAVHGQLGPPHHGRVVAGSARFDSIPSSRVVHHPSRSSPLEYF